jgi:hypothetical protein
MRRPAQHHLGPTPRTAWAHPYTGVLAAAVFYNDGGQGGAPAPAAPAVPSPADVAARAGQQPPTPQPAAPQTAGVDEAVLLDHGTGAPMTQSAFTKIMARENSKGRRAALRELAESAGLPFDPDDFDPKKFGQLLKDAEVTRKERLTEEQRRQEELTTQAQTLQDDRTKLDQDRAQIAADRRALAREQALTRLGALDIADDQGNVTAPNLQDALAMLDRDLRDNPDADAATLAAAADKLKQRRPELFGAPAAPLTLPPAPSGGPAGGNAPRQPVGDKDAINAAARQMAIDRGLRAPDAA